MRIGKDSPRSHGGHGEDGKTEWRTKTFLFSRPSSLCPPRLRGESSSMPPLPQGTGPLFTDPSAEALRAAFRAKPRALADKLTTVADAVARLVHDGDYLAIGGFGGDRLP